MAFAVHPAGMTCPVREFVEADVIVAGGIGELAARGHPDDILTTVVRGSVDLIVLEGGEAQARLGGFLGVPGDRAAFQGRQPVDLLCVEDRGKEHAWLAQLHGFLPGVALGVQHGPALGVLDRAFLLELPVLNQRALLAPAHLCARVVGLLVGQPTRIGPLLAKELD